MKLSVGLRLDTPRLDGGNRPIEVVFLGRGGVLNRRGVERSYILVIEDFNISLGVPELIPWLSALGVLVFVVTSQRGIARKLVDQAEVDRMRRHFEDVVGSAGGRKEKFYWCFHDQVEACDCGTPNPAMLLEAERDYKLNLKNMDECRQ